MSKDVLKEQVGGPNFYGDPTFGGTGNFGKGGYKQLATALDPATEKIRKQEESEIEQNVSDQQWSLGKFDQGRVSDGNPLPHWDGRNGSVETVAEQAPYDNSTSRMRDLPGFPQMNALVNPKSFVPANDHPRNVDLISGKKAEYLGPTLNGVPLMTDNHTKDPQDDPNKELDALLGDLAPPEEEDGRDPHEDEDLILHQFVEAVIEETLVKPNGNYPNRQGWKNSQINSLAWRKNQMNPEQDPPEMWHKTFEDPKDHNPPVDNIPPPRAPATHTPSYGFGAIGFPKQFVPKDYEQANPDYDEIIKDPIGRRRLTLPPDETDERVGVNASIREVFTTTTSEDISEMGFRNREDWDEHPSEHTPRHGETTERDGEVRIWSDTHGVWLTPEDWEGAHGEGSEPEEAPFPPEGDPEMEEPDFPLSLEYPEEDMPEPFDPFGVDE